MHVIDDTSTGADGVRLADANGDGLLDIATGWEEGGVVRVYLHPGAPAVRKPWPRVTVGEVATQEDAVLVDLDNDGAMDLVVSAEHAKNAYGVEWTPLKEAPETVSWNPVSGLRGIKYDAVRPIDLDDDGDLDVITCEERENLGVVWYENTRQ